MSPSSEDMQGTGDDGNTMMHCVQNGHTPEAITMHGLPAHHCGRCDSLWMDARTLAHIAQSAGRAAENRATIRDGYLSPVLECPCCQSDGRWICIRRLDGMAVHIDVCDRCFGIRLHRKALRSLHASGALRELVHAFPGPA